MVMPPPLGFALGVRSGSSDSRSTTSFAGAAYLSIDQTDDPELNAGAEAARR